MGRETDGILSEIASNPDAAYNDCCDRFGEHLIHKLIDGGVLCAEGEELLFDCPVFLREDAVAIRTDITARVKKLVGLLECNLEKIRACCAAVDNGFPVELNLYHILCGMVFDGLFFDYLCKKSAVATSRQHPSGLDYLTVIYKKCKELDSLSKGLLCSYNRLVNDNCSLQSFGDANGSRFDFYRFFRSTEHGRISAKFKDVAELFWRFHSANKDALLAEVVSLIRTGWCDSNTLVLLERFGYVRDGKTVYLFIGRSIVKRSRRLSKLWSAA